MFENLQVFENRYEELTLKLYDPQTAGDREAFAALMKEHKELEPIVEAYRAWRQCQEDLAGARELLESEGDKELRELAVGGDPGAGREGPGFGGGAEAPAAAQRPQRREERDLGDTGGHRRGRGRPVRLRPVPDVHRLRPAPGLAHGDCGIKRDGAGGL